MWNEEGGKILCFIQHSTRGLRGTCSPGNRPEKEPAYSVVIFSNYNVLIKCIFFLFFLQGFYYFALVSNLFLRLSWVLTVSVGEAGLFHSEVLTALLAVLEVFRSVVVLVGFLTFVWTCHTKREYYVTGAELRLRLLRYLVKVLTSQGGELWVSLKAVIALLSNLCKRKLLLL